MRASEPARSLSLFPWRVERWLLRRWPLVVLGPFLACLAVALLAPSTEQRMRFVGSTLRDSIFVSAVIFLLLAGLLFRRWADASPNAFAAFVAAAPGADGRAELGRYQSRLHSRWRFLLIAGACLLAAVLFFGRGGLGVLPRLSQAEAVFFIVKWGLSPLAWCYGVGAAAWCIAVTTWTWIHLGRGQQLRPRLGHPDRCGGLAPVGRSIVLGSAPFLVASGYLAAIAFGFQPPDPGAGAAWLAHSSPAPPVRAAARLLLFLFALPVGLAALLVPVWAIHRSLLAAHQRRVESLLPIYESALSRLQGLVADRRLEEAAAARRDFEAVAAVHPQRLASPLWPLRFGWLAGLATPQLLALLAGLARWIRSASS